MAIKVLCVRALWSCKFMGISSRSWRILGSSLGLVFIGKLDLLLCSDSKLVQLLSFAYFLQSALLVIPYISIFGFFSPPLSFSIPGSPLVSLCLSITLRFSSSNPPLASSSKPDFSFSFPMQPFIFFSSRLLPGGFSSSL